jgi:hypothetical protein
VGGKKGDTILKQNHKPSNDLRGFYVYWKEEASPPGGLVTKQLGAVDMAHISAISYSDSPQL